MIGDVPLEDPDDDEPEARGPGRPRDVRVDEAIVEAASHLLATLGPAGFTVDAVASRAGVGKATIYRRWPSRGRLMLAAAHEAAVDLPEPDTGSVREDLVIHMTSLVTKLRGTVAGRLLPALLVEAVSNAEMQTLLSDFVRARRQLAARMVGRGIQRRELPRDTDVELMLDMLAGPIFVRLLFTQDPVEPSDIERIIDGVLRAMSYRDTGARGG